MDILRNGYDVMGFYSHISYTEHNKQQKGELIIVNNRFLHFECYGSFVVVNMQRNIFTAKPRIICCSGFVCFFIFVCLYHYPIKAVHYEPKKVRRKDEEEVWSRTTEFRSLRFHEGFVKQHTWYACMSTNRPPSPRCRVFSSQFSSASLSLFPPPVLLSLHLSLPLARLLGSSPAPGFVKPEQHLRQHVIRNLLSDQEDSGSGCSPSP